MLFARHVYLKVLLLEFDDIVNHNYTNDFINNLIFGTQPSTTPNGLQIPTTVRNYFLDVSDFNIEICGEVLGWKRANGYQITMMPHYKSNTMNDTNYAELGFIIPQICMRTFGYTGHNIKKLKEIETGPHKGKPVDGILIYFTDYIWTGGGNRTWQWIKENFTNFKNKDVYKNHNLEIVRKLTKIHWDNGWDDLADIAILPAIEDPLRNIIADTDNNGIWNKNVSLNIPSFSLTSLDTLIHEIGHLPAIRLYDLVGVQNRGWGNLDAFDYALRTYSPRTLSAFSRNGVGWLNLTSFERITRRNLQIMPITSHKIAYKFPNGIDPERKSNAESIITECREILNYNVPNFNPPNRLGSALVFYRLDPCGRRISNIQGTVTGRLTSIIRGYNNLDEYHTSPLTGVIIPSQQGSIGRYNFSLSSRNCLQELWWEFTNVNPVGSGMRFNAEFRPIDLISNYDNASWSSSTKDSITPNTLSSNDGIVALKSRSIQESLFGPREFQNVLLLQPPAMENGWIRAEYNFPAIKGNNFRLYVVVANFRQFINFEESFEFEFVHYDNSPGIDSPEKGSLKIQLKNVGEIKTISMDILNFTGTLIIYMRNKENTKYNSAYIIKAFLVPLPRIYYDFFENISSPNATWNNNDGAVLNTEGGLAKVRFNKDVTLHDEITYGPKVLNLDLGRPPNNHIKGVFANIPIQNNMVFSAQMGIDQNRLFGRDFRLSFVIRDNTGNIIYSIPQHLIYKYGSSTFTPPEFRSNANPVYAEPKKLNRTTIFEINLEDLAGNNVTFEIYARLLGENYNYSALYLPSMRIYDLS